MLPVASSTADSNTASRNSVSVAESSSPYVRLVAHDGQKMLLLLPLNVELLALLQVSVRMEECRQCPHPHMKLQYSKI